MIIRRNLAPRATRDDSKSNPALIAVTASIGSIFIFIAIYVYIRKKRLQNPKYIPTSEDSQKSRWRLPFQSSPIRLRRLFTPSSSSPSPPNPNEETSYASSTHTTNTQATEMASSNINVNRNTSIRSIMTLPPYHPSPNPNERLIAREGERAGVDTVIEFPETADEEEARREQDMDALYQIRQTRRQEVDERNERRRQRQEAREQGDWARLEQLRLDAQRRARARAESTGSAASSTVSLPSGSARELIAEHAARTTNRGSRVSSVSYADLGLARHDGSRLRADSVESDHRPLLDSAASISGINNNNSNNPNTSNISENAREAPRRTSRFRLPIFGPRQTHARALSAESTLTTDSEIADLTPQTSSAERSGSGSDPAVHTPSASASASEPSPPIGEPPSYEGDAYYGLPPGEEEEEQGAPPPDYTSPVRERGEGVPRLPSVRVETRLPAIEIVGSTPVTGQRE